MRWFNFLVLFVFVLSRCEEPIWSRISEDDKPYFSNGDTLIFHSDGIDADTFVIKRSEGVRISDKRYHYEQIYVAYGLVKHDSLFTDGFLTIHQETSGCNLFTDFTTVESYTPRNGLEISNTTLAKRNGNFTTTNVTEILYHPHYGISTMLSETMLSSNYRCVPERPGVAYIRQYFRSLERPDDLIAAGYQPQSPEGASHYQRGVAPLAFKHFKNVL